MMGLIFVDVLCKIIYLPTQNELPYRQLVTLYFVRYCLNSSVVRLFPTVVACLLNPFCFV